MRYASISKLHAASSLIAAIATFSLSNALSAIALLKLATSASQSAAAAAPLSASKAESGMRDRRKIEDIYLPEMNVNCEICAASETRRNGGVEVQRLSEP